MREILFRGKRIDNGEWIEGSLINDGRCFIAIHPSLAFGPTSKGEINGETLWGFYPFFEVDPSTVGQYIGLTDKNGKKIFEGDIIHRVSFIGMGYREERGEVVYRAPVFLADCKHNRVLHFSQYPTENGDTEVIGNIHDNPELLEVGE